MTGPAIDQNRRIVRTRCVILYDVAFGNTRRKIDSGIAGQGAGQFEHGRPSLVRRTVVGCQADITSGKANCRVPGDGKVGEINDLII